MAVGETLRRLAGKVLLSTGVAKAQTATLAPTQVGVGVPGAAESVVIATQNLVDTLGGTANWMMLKVDITNAFNTVHRLSVLQSALAYCPAAFNYLNFAYRAPAPLFVGGQVLASETGTPRLPVGTFGICAGHPTNPGGPGRQT